MLHLLRQGLKADTFHSRFSALVEHSLSIALQKSIPVGMQYLPSKQPSSPGASP